MNHNSELTWCVSTCNNLNYLTLLLQSIERNSYYKDSPIIIYAENCNDGTYEFLKTESLKINSNIIAIYEDNEIPKGIGGGANEAISRVKTEYFNLIHSDMYISKDYDKVLLDLCKQNDKSVCCAWRLEPDVFDNHSRLGTTKIDKEEFGYYHNTFNFFDFEIFAEDFKQLNPNINFRKLEGVSFCMKKSDWDFIGGNDSQFAPSSFEDHDLSVRMTCEGYTFITTSNALVWHFAARGSHFIGDDLTKTSERQRKSEFKNIPLWRKKWGEFPMKFDNNGMIMVSENMKKLYFESKNK